MTKRAAAHRNGKHLVVRRERARSKTAARQQEPARQHGEHTGQQTFAEVQYEHRIAADFAHGTDGVRGADVAGAVLADVRVIKDLRYDDPEGHRSQQERHDEQPDCDQNFHLPLPILA